MPLLKMKKIPSFTIDHNRLERGVYVSRRDFTPSGDCLTTFDVRMTLPNRQKAITPQALHAMEHLAATFLRNHPVWAPKVVYWGPMGCCTGNYLILQGELVSNDIIGLLRETFALIATYPGTEADIPGATPRDCGNYSFMDLDAARRAARIYLEEVLPDPATVYPAEE